MNTPVITGLIFNVQRDSTEDGPGIRTTVFMKGCTMRCPWCHNPEGINPAPELVWYETRCIGAGECIKACPRGALALTKDGVIIDRSLCDICGECAVACPANALEVLGKKRTVKELVDTVIRDRVFYEKSGGGITLSGGEPSMQAGFSAALMKIMRQEGIHVALDTCGGSNWNALGPLVNLADLVLLDLKLMDGENHLKYTGIPLELVLTNAKEVVKMEKTLWVRTPVIPGHTDSEENIRRVARFIRNKLPTTERYDILAFNNACATKYHRLGITWKLGGEGLMSDERMETLAGAARDEGLDFVHWSGMTRAEK